MDGSRWRVGRGLAYGKRRTALPKRAGVARIMTVVERLMRGIWLKRRFVEAWILTGPLTVGAVRALVRKPFSA